MGLDAMGTNEIINGTTKLARDVVGGWSESLPFVAIFALRCFDALMGLRSQLLLTNSGLINSGENHCCGMYISKQDHANTNVQALRLHMLYHNHKRT